MLKINLIKEFKGKINIREEIHTLLKNKCGFVPFEQEKEKNYA